MLRCIVRVEEDLLKAHHGLLDTTIFPRHLGSGDRAIHLLTSNCHGTDKRTIERAFQVHGGRDHAADRIDKVVQCIENMTCANLLTTSPKKG